MVVQSVCKVWEGRIQALSGYLDLSWVSYSTALHFGVLRCKMGRKVIPLHNPGLWSRGQGCKKRRRKWRGGALASGHPLVTFSFTPGAADSHIPLAPGRTDSWACSCGLCLLLANLQTLQAMTRVRAMVSIKWNNTHEAPGTLPGSRQVLSKHWPLLLSPFYRL